MPGALEAVHVRVRQAVDEVVEVAVAEDRVAGSPQQQRGDVQGPQALGDPVELGGGGVARVDGDVRDEAADPTAAGGVGVGGAEAVLDRAAQRRVRQGEGGPPATGC